MRVKIIEKNKQETQKNLQSELSLSIIFNGDGLDEELLKETNMKSKQFSH